MGGEVEREERRGKRTYGWLSGRALRLNTFACHAQGQNSQEDVEKLHDERLNDLKWGSV